jgi:putative transcriptional regulator
LEQEILDNNWLNSPYSQNVLFDTEINQRWQRAAEEIGIDINQLITQAGHA